MANLPNIDYKKPNKNPTVESPASFTVLPFYKDLDYFASSNNLVSFIKAVEKLVRTHDDYKLYKSKLFGIGLTYCQVLSNIDERDFMDEEDHNNTTNKSLLEMHHGPVFTLFDIAYIIINWAIKTERRDITTFKIAEIILAEHFNNNVQVVMLSKTVHEQVHEGNIFISFHQAFGDLNAFVKKYEKGLDTIMIKKLNKYIERSIEYGSFDKGVLELNRTVKDWSERL